MEYNYALFDIPAEICDFLTEHQIPKENILTIAHTPCGSYEWTLIWCEEQPIGKEKANG